MFPAAVVDFFGSAWPLVFGVLVVVVEEVVEFLNDDPLEVIPIPFFFSNPNSSSGKNSRLVLFSEGTFFPCSLVPAVVFMAPFVPPFLVTEDAEVDDEVLPICVKTISAAPSPKPPIAAASATTVGIERTGGGGEEATDPFLTPVLIRAFSRTAFTRRRT